MQTKRPQAAAAAGSSRRIGVIWQGSFFAHHSFANVNREVARRLAHHPGLDIGLVADEPSDGDGDSRSHAHGIAELVGHRPPVLAWYVRHRWPPDFARPGDARFVVMQPWEFTQVPTAWVEAIAGAVDEVWTPSAFCRDAFVRSGVDADKVTVVPLGVDVDVFHPDAPPWRLPTDRAFRFLFVGGAIERKGFDLLLRAYVREFSRDDDVCLVVKDFYYGGHAGEVVRDLARRPGAPEIRYSYGPTAPHRLGGLFTACDCYVHPYRGEGFGLPIAEAMACGLAVIVTAAGPAMEYCTDDTAYLLAAAEVPVPVEVWPPTLPTARAPSWYEPDLAHVRALLRHVYEHRDEARRKGMRASERVRRHLTWEGTVEQVAARLRRRGLAA